MRIYLLILDTVLWKVFGDAEIICPHLVRSDCMSITQWHKSHMF